MAAWNQDSPSRYRHAGKSLAWNCMGGLNGLNGERPNPEAAWACYRVRWPVWFLRERGTKHAKRRMSLGAGVPLFNLPRDIPRSCRSRLIRLVPVQRKNLNREIFSRKISLSSYETLEGYPRNNKPLSTFEGSWSGPAPSGKPLIHSPPRTQRNGGMINTFSRNMYGGIKPAKRRSSRPGVVGTV